jgi:hypothetical protein
MRRNYALKVSRRVKFPPAGHCCYFTESASSISF